MMDISDVEVDIDTAVRQAIETIGDRENDLLHYFGPVLQYADEPKFFSYNAKLKDKTSASKVGHGSASGFSFFSKETAVLKCLLEALERYALKTYDRRKVIFAPVEKLKTPYLDPSSVVGFSDAQRQTNPDLRLQPGCEYAWIKGKALPSLKDTYIPAQLVYMSYRRKAKEQLLRLPISTGAAAGSAYSAAIYRGICEIVERDALMITYLNSLPRSRVPLHLSKNKQIQQILQIAANYNLEVQCFDITTDLDIYTFFTIIVDRTGVAASISTGLKSGLDPVQTVIGSIQEAFHPRAWIRRKKDQYTGNRSALLKPVELAERGILWASLDALKYLDFLLSSPHQTKNIDLYENRSTKNSGRDLQKIVAMLADKGCTAYFVDITPALPQLETTHFKIIMAVVPQLQPMHLDENYKYLGGSRFYEVPVTLGYLKKPHRESELNKYPHPFL